MESEAVKQWNSSADDYQRVFKLGQSDYNRAVLAFWREAGLLCPGDRVLDLGCGVGKYGAMLAEAGHAVTLLDISEDMLRHAEKNMAHYKTPWQTLCCDFSALRGDEPLFTERYELVISTMSPAVSGLDDVRKMTALSGRGCFVSRFASWRQPLRDRILETVCGRSAAPFGDPAGDCEALTEAVRAAGYLPRTQIVDYPWCDLRTPEEMADYLLRRSAADALLRPEMRDALVRAAEAEVQTDGFVHDEVLTTVLWLWWTK
ncbi:MAG: methyltransferase domain-containing protein [Oscillospiraceae bacterium]|nr:methyltransferase domain-containing protein [Oscillospiraceae bacterium]